MLTLTFDEFSNPDKFPDDDHIELYVLRDREKILYVGISKSNVWNRWFGNRGRIWKTETGWNGTDSVAYSIIENMPESLNWSIDLWNLGECLDFLNIKFDKHPEYPSFFIRPGGCSWYEIDDVEPKMIGKLSPRHNGTYNHGKEDSRERSRYLEYIERSLADNR